jgi:hypothetical protein
VVDDEVFVSDPQSGSILSVPAAGGTSTTVASGQNQPWAIAADSEAVFWTTYFGGTVMMVVR